MGNKGGTPPPFLYIGDCCMGPVLVIVKFLFHITLPLQSGMEISFSVTLQTPDFHKRFFPPGPINQFITKTILCHKPHLAHLINLNHTKITCI
jgi:hypothetical protein